ncbi:aminoacyl-tRNA hydrolase, partial [Melioribacter sp. Ez-97]|uniref:aminoacyl-tRNA hydrolase n=1 Tax=Melioribacter sp. Ez-97 TaxID=3423434 RepID=UPI003EDAF7DC
MRAVIGLGNPGKEYENTRHNIGFIVLDRFADLHNLNFKPEYNYLISEGSIGSSDFILVKPVTFMNLSGLAVKNLLRKYEIPTEEMLVITDDIYLEAGRLRIRKSGGDGGHNGLKSIIEHLESNNFPRLRFGIGEPGDLTLSEYVLSPFPEDELKTINSSVEKAVQLTECFVSGGYKAMLDHFSKISSGGKSG